ncbi:hypothetical protein V8G54_000495 [Vigna mungo]|uniref:Uncharacterized protein n=1 Tax=Vigna mungo TaxID=3915 RepID=A0AAQ3P6M3_VIGMU
MDVAITDVRSPAIVLGRPISASASARLSSTSSFPESHLLLLCFTSLTIPKQGRRRGFVRAASSLPESSEADVRITRILCLLPVDQQLEQLQTDRDADQQKEEPSASGTDFDFVQVCFILMSSHTLLSFSRIAEVKANERRKALEEILYELVVQKFIGANISLTPYVTPDLFQLEKTMKVLPSEVEEENNSVQQTKILRWIMRNYVMSLNGDTLQRYPIIIRSKEAISIIEKHTIEKHTEALFGRPEIVVTPEVSL